MDKINQPVLVYEMFLIVLQLVELLERIRRCVSWLKV